MDQAIQLANEGCLPPLGTRMDAVVWNGMHLGRTPPIRIDAGEHGQFLLTQGLWKTMPWHLGTLPIRTCAGVSRSNVDAPCATPADTCSQNHATCDLCGFRYCSHHATCHRRVYQIDERSLDDLCDVRAWLTDRADGLISQRAPWRDYRRRKGRP